MSNRALDSATRSRARFTFTLMLAAVLHFAPSGDARAQDAQTQEKAALIKELVGLTGSNANARAIMNSVATQVRQDRQRLFEEAVNRMEFLSAKEREELIRREREDAERIDDRVFGLFDERIDLNRVVEEISSELFEKYYTADELRDLVAFYKSPTGRKSVKVMPQLFADSMAKTSERVLPYIGPIMKQIMDEEKDRLDKILPPKPQPRPQPKKAPRRRRT